MKLLCAVSLLHFSFAHNGFVCPNYSLEISLSASASQKKDNYENNSNGNNPHTPTHAPAPGMIVHHFIYNLKFLQMHCCLLFSFVLPDLYFCVVILDPVEKSIVMKSHLFVIGFLYITTTP